MGIIIWDNGELFLGGGLEWNNGTQEGGWGMEGEHLGSLGWGKWAAWVGVGVRLPAWPVRLAVLQAQPPHP